MPITRWPRRWNDATSASTKRKSKGSAGSRQNVEAEEWSRSKRWHVPPALEKINDAKKDYLRFLAQYRPRKELSYAAELGLVVRAADDVFMGRPVDEVLIKYQKDRAALLALQPGLSDFRLYWEAASKALSGRDLLLIDSDKVSGRRNLMLFDPELFRIPVPMFLPRAPSRAPTPNEEGQ